MLNFGNNNILTEDFKYIVDNNEYLIEELRNKSFFITGATGLVGSLIIRFLLYLSNENDANIRIYGLARNEEKVKEIYGEEYRRKNGLYICYGQVEDDCESYLPMDANIDFILHTASVTSSKVMVSSPVETIMTAVNGTDKILNLAKNKNVKSAVYVSSMEMYGSFPGDKNEKRSERELGYIDPLSVRSNYPESKRMCENLCIAYLSEYGVPVKIARLSQTFGAGVLPWENRVFAQFAKSVIKGEDIVLHTKGLSEGNYCYSADMIAGLFTILMRGNNGEAYNVVNDGNHSTIVGMAKLVAENNIKNKVNVIFDIADNEKYGYAADTHLFISGEKLMSLGWKPRYNLLEMYNRLIEYIDC